MVERFDVALIGAGQANVPLARKLVDAGKRTALIERQHVGGSCVNFGCTPSKAVQASADLAHQIRRADEYGLRVGRLTVDYDAVLARGRAIAEESRTYLVKRFEGMVGDCFSFLRGHARFAGRDGDAYRLDIDGVGTLTADTVVIDTGTRTVIPDIDGLDAITYTTAEDWLDMTPLPDRLLMVGGGYIGLESGQFAQRMGAHVTIVESGDQIAGHEDPDVADAVREMLNGEGINVRTCSAVSAVRKTDAGIVAALCAGQKLQHGQHGKETCQVTADHLFLTPGRKPNTDDLGLETIGLSPRDNGTLAVDGARRTGLPNLFAVGDITGGKMFTHNAHADHAIVLNHLTGDGSATADGRFVPYAMFLDPPLGRAGMSEHEAREKGHHVACIRFNIAKSDKHREEGHRDGFIKLVGDRANGKLLGAACFCHGGDDLAQFFQVCLVHGGDLRLLTDAMFIHPILAEAVLSAAGQLQNAMESADVA